MISCTEFIPSYSELFTYIENKWGFEEVQRYWDYLFEPDGTKNALINFVEKEGIKGCYTYWNGTLNEEAADFTMYLNEKDGWYRIVMHHCPSKGRLLDLQKSIGVKPYPKYCLHCDYYRKAIEKVGLKYIYDFCGQDKAQCSLLIYDPKVFTGRLVVDENTIVQDKRAAQNEYFHRAFHGSLNSGMFYLAEKHSVQDIVDYLTQFTKNVYGVVIEDVKKRGLVALQEKILDTYKKEKAEDAVEVKLNGDTLEVVVKYCPAVKFFRDSNYKVSEHYPMTTSVVMQTIADETGYKFTMGEYDHKTGATSYTFTK